MKKVFYKIMNAYKLYHLAMWLIGIGTMFVVPLFSYGSHVFEIIKYKREHGADDPESVSSMNISSLGSWIRSYDGVLSKVAVLSLVLGTIIIMVVIVLQIIMWQRSNSTQSLEYDDVTEDNEQDDCAYISSETAYSE